MSAIEHPELLDQLRHQIRSGVSVADAMRIGLGRGSRLIVIAYFRAAFHLNLQDASKLGAWEFFEGASWSDDIINAEIGPILTRSLAG